MKTTLKKSAEVNRKWYQIDASQYRLGRLSTRVARLLMGKHYVDYTPHTDMGDFVVVINAAKVQFTGKKLEQKKYHRFSGYPGGITTTTLKDVMGKNPDFAVREAVRKMLPKNKLRKFQLRRLRILKDDKHSLKIDQVI